MLYPGTVGWYIFGFVKADLMIERIKFHLNNYLV